MGDMNPVSLRGVSGLGGGKRVPVVPAAEANEAILSLWPTILNDAMCAVIPCPLFILTDTLRLSDENGLDLVKPTAVLPFPFRASPSWQGVTRRSISALALFCRLRCRISPVPFDTEVVGVIGTFTWVSDTGETASAVESASSESNTALCGWVAVLRCLHQSPDRQRSTSLRVVGSISRI